MTTSTINEEGETNTGSVEMAEVPSKKFKVKKRTYDSTSTLEE